MDNTKREDRVFEMIGCCAMVIAALAVTAALCQVIAMALPVLESMLIPRLAAQSAPRTLVAVFAHGDDEGVVSPILARYAREGARVYVIIATDGAQGGRHTSIPRVSFS